MPSRAIFTPLAAINVITTLELVCIYHTYWLLHTWRHWKQPLFKHNSSGQFLPVTLTATPAIIPLVNFTRFNTAVIRSGATFPLLLAFITPRAVILRERAGAEQVTRQ